MRCVGFPISDLLICYFLLRAGAIALQYRICVVFSIFGYRIAAFQYRLSVIIFFACGFAMSGLAFRNAADEVRGGSSPASYAHPPI